MVHPHRRRRYYPAMWEIVVGTRLHACRTTGCAVRMPLREPPFTSGARVLVAWAQQAACFASIWGRIVCGTTEASSMRHDPMNDGPILGYLALAIALAVMLAA
jgi:hypothetical protein